MALSEKFLERRDKLLALEPGWDDDCPLAAAPSAGRMALACAIMAALAARGVPDGTLFPVGNELDSLDLCWEHSESEQAQACPTQLRGPLRVWQHYVSITLEDGVLELADGKVVSNGMKDTMVFFSWFNDANRCNTEELRLTESQATADNAGVVVADWMFGLLQNFE